MLKNPFQPYRNRIDLFLRERLGWLPARIALGIMAWFGFVNLYMVRVNISVAIIAMAKRNISGGKDAVCLSLSGENALMSTIDGENSSSQWSAQDGEGKNSFLLQPSTKYEEGEFEWDETIQGLILGSFFYGYAFTQIIGGRLAEMYGAKLVYGGGILAGGISALLSPMMARLHYGALIALRIIQGLLQGVTWPAMHACISRWIPPLERPRFIAIVYLANTLSSAMTMPMCGLIIANHGWAAQFYIMGSLSILWSCIWFTFMHNSPEDHPRISQNELNFLQTVLKESGTQKTTTRRVPWKDISRSTPMWAILVYGIGNGWGISIFFSQLPKYMSNVLGFSIKSNGALSAVPFICRYIGGIIWSTLGSWLVAHKHLSVTSTRKVFGILGLCGPAVMILGVSFAECDAKVIVVLFCLALLFNGAGTTSGFVNHTDIAPNFAGTLLGISNTIGSLIAFLVPVVNGIIISGEQTLASWQKVFWICVPIYLTAAAFYARFASGEVQPWNDIDSLKSASAKKHKTSDVLDGKEEVPLRSLK